MQGIGECQKNKNYKEMIQSTKNDFHSGKCNKISHNINPSQKNVHQTNLSTILIR